MFQYDVGECVLYGQHGVFRITDIRREKFSGLSENDYYIMTSVYFDRDIYLAVDSPLTSQMRPVLTEDEANAAIDLLETETSTCPTQAKVRETEYSQMLRSGKHMDALRVVKSLSVFKSDMQSNKKRIHAVDEKMLSIAEKLITEEFAYALNIERQEVIPYILIRISNMPN